MTRILFRVALSGIAALATFYFVYWIPFSLLFPHDDFGWFRNIGSLTPSVIVGWYLWSQTGSLSKGLYKSAMIGAVVAGSLGFAAGFFGPMVFDPSANQGPSPWFRYGPSWGYRGCFRWGNLFYSSAP
jgi:hypothetical protein